MKCDSQERVLADLRNEANHWKRRYEEAANEIVRLRNDARGVIGANYDTVGELHKVHAHNSCLHTQFELENIRSQELQVPYF